MLRKNPGFEVALNDRECRRLQNLRTSEKAIEITKKYLKSKFPSRQYFIDEDKKGADLKVISKSMNRTVKRIEVKGTISDSLKFSQLKISSKKTYESLKNGVPIYRVMNVSSRKPRIAILYFGKDFQIVCEDRWAVRGVRK